MFLKNPEDLQLYYAEIPTLVFSFEICEIFKNIYFEEVLLNISKLQLQSCAHNKVINSVV